MTAWSRPTMRSVSQDEGDATVSLSLESKYIEGDSQIPCEVSATVLGEGRPFAVGDTILIVVREDDVIGDDLLWETEVVVDAAIADVQQFTMTYDCSFPATGDALGSMEVYAKVEVDKEDCGGICEGFGGEDTPSTPNIYMLRVEDDDAEEDDTSTEAVEDPERLTPDRVCRDADWFKVSFDYPVELLARLESHLVGGDLNLKLYDRDFMLLGEASEEASGDSKSLRPSSALQPGDYWLEVTPADVENFNFYDLYVVESQVMTDCAAGAVETRPCGNCGREERACNDGGEWGPWSSCLGMGSCTPGEEESVGCEEGGSRARLCDAMCEWGEFSSCVQCEDGSMESCYTGPSEAAGVGACVEGVRTCSRGQWSSCQGDELPRAEVCADVVDNDCDGLTDANDPECAAGLGDACSAGDCGDLECLMGPFIGGYCGGSDCSSCGAGSACGEVAGQEYCLKSCLASSDCRGGYQCAPVGRGGAQVCVPLCSGNQDCGAGQVCNASRLCEEAPSGGEGGSVGATRGDACLNTMCESSLECLMGPFPDGYCGNQGCAQCGAGGACGVVGGESFCLKSCAGPTDCRAGYLCAPAGFQGEAVCVPPCASDAECGAGYACTEQRYCAASTSLPACGAQGPCPDGQACADLTGSGELTCVPTCADDSQCAEGQACGSDGFCQALNPAPTPSAPQPEEGCQQNKSPTTLWLLALALGLSLRRRSRHSLT